MPLKESSVVEAYKVHECVNGLRTEKVLDYTVVMDDLSSCVESIVNWIVVGGSGRWMACLNPHSYVVALNRPKFEIALMSADWLAPDGTGIVIASRILGGQIRKRITGSDFFFGLLSKLNKRGGHDVFFVGSTEETLAAICERMALDFPNVRVAGTYSPPFRAEFSPIETDEMLKAINQARPDVLWVGMTAPKQELWIHDNLGRLESVRFVGAIGAVFDFYAGEVKRSHPIFQNIGLEWLPRLLREPKRLWRRTIISAPIFVWHVIKARFGYHPAER